MWSFDHVRRFIEQGKRAFGAGQMRLHRGHLLADGLQRPIKLRQIAHYQHKAAASQGARLDRADANENHRGHSGGSNYCHQDAEAPFHRGQAHSRPKAQVGLLDKSPLLAILLPKRLHDPGRAQYFVHHRQRGAFDFFHFLGLPAQPPAINSRNDKNHRGNPQRHQGQSPVDPGDGTNHRGERQRRREERNNAIHRNIIDGGGVVLNAVGRIRRAFRVMVRKREPLHMPKQLRAEAPQQLFAGKSGQQGAAELANLS